MVTSLLREIAAEEGIELLVEPEWGYVGRLTRRDGSYCYYHNTTFDINGLGSSEIAKDKGYASFFLKTLGYPVPEERAFYDDEWCRVIRSDQNAQAALTFAGQLGYPVIVKPNSQSQGRGVEAVHTPDELMQALSAVFSGLKDHVALVQRMVPGDDYRIVVLGDEVLCAYRRTPLSVVGNGHDTVGLLLEAKQREFVARGRDTVIKPDDPRIARQLQHKGWTMGTVLPDGTYCRLLANANLSSGGDAEDVTSVLHTEYRRLAVTLTRAMGLKFCGLDIMTAGRIDEPPGEYTVIEINSAPGLDYYSEGGEAQRRIVKELYRKLVLHVVGTV